MIKGKLTTINVGMRQLKARGEEDSELVVLTLHLFQIFLRILLETLEVKAHQEGLVTEEMI